MKFLLSLLCSVISIGAVAQVSVGARVVANHHLSTYAMQYRPEDPSADPVLEWDKDLFGRCAIKNWAFEISVNHSKERGTINEYGHYYSNYYDTRYLTVNKLMFNSAVQYNVWSMGKKKLVKNYIGLSLGPQYTRYKERYISEDRFGIVRYDETYKYGRYILWPGLHYTVCYEVSKHLQISGNIFSRSSLEALTINPGPYDGEDLQIGVGIGASYKITP